MGTKPWLLIVILVLLLVLALVVFFSAKGKKKPTDYYALFVIGLVWAIFGLFSFFRYDGLSSFFSIGIIFMIIGLVNKDKWKKNRKTWKNMSKGQKKMMITILIVLSILLLAGVIVLLYTRRTCGSYI